MQPKTTLYTAALPLMIALVVGAGDGTPGTEWKHYGGRDNIHYSPLRQIDRTNVARLQVAWTYDTRDAFPGSEMQCHPLVIGGVVYGTTPKGGVIALDAATGTLRWSFDPGAGAKTMRVRNRGVTWWESGGERRVFVTFRNWLYALDSATGKPAPGFGSEGRVDLRQGLGRDPEHVTISASTPGAIYRDLLILGSTVGEDLPSAPGDIRAFDVRTGRIRWTFHTIPRPGEFGYETWPPEAWKHTGGANSWAGMTVDHARGLVFVPTGSAAFDFWGGDRKGDNLFANCLLALKADTGERVWHFQAVRHDVWDRDFPAPPNLVTLVRDGRRVDAVAQITKSGHVFVFERATGKPLFPIEYRKAPASDIEGEALAGTQPLPLKPPPFARQRFTEEMATRRTPAAHKAVVERLRTLRNGGQFTPPSLAGTVIFPGFDGGGEWGGAAFDPATGLLYVNSNEMPWVLRLLPRTKPAARAGGRALYLRNCASCHGPDMRGTPPEFPALAGLAKKYTEPEMAAVIRKGGGRMPGFAQVGEAAVLSIARYVLTGKDTEAVSAGAIPFLPFTHDGYKKFLDPDGYPAVAPPWGTLSAIDLNRGEIAWQIPFGEFPELAAKGMRDTGTENYGGPLVTAGGLLFIGATNHDRKFHAYDKANGKLLWEATLPAAGNATPASYEIAGRQYVVIAAGGGKSGAPSGGSYIAFALPGSR